MNSKKLHIIGIAGVMMLFAVFTLMHQYDWLIPTSPASPISTQTSVPFPDVVEEHGTEDDITHDFSKPFFISESLQNISICMIFEDLVYPQISTPPPDNLI
ncbi:MAG: hypothetical protein GVY07_05030 [Bacteroidetes bacterium]|jgi:hypothetical protein|nr:hypothetical protein [Bacteroidota bacterium]